MDATPTPSSARSNRSEIVLLWRQVRASSQSDRQEIDPLARPYTTLKVGHPSTTIKSLGGLSDSGNPAALVAIDGRPVRPRWDGRARRAGKFGWHPWNTSFGATGALSTQSFAADRVRNVS